MHKPAWFADDSVITSNAPTCGINKDGKVQYRVDPVTGIRSSEVDDRLAEDVAALVQGGGTPTVQTVPLQSILETGIAVPAYYDRRTVDAFLAFLDSELTDFQPRTLGELIDDQVIEVRRGHGSPSLDQRTGDVPYIKVSDLRAGLVNINPTNMIPEALAKKYWKGDDSGLQAFDLTSPERASKNIGDFCVLMPGQERIVLTREVLVFRVGKEANFDAFYLLWAMSLKPVRAQWSRIVLMQTNREDVGMRYRELMVPIPPSQERASVVSQSFRSYFTKLAELRAEFQNYLTGEGEHHFFVGTAEREALDQASSDLEELADEVVKETIPDSE